MATLKETYKSQGEFKASTLQELLAKNSNEPRVKKVKDYIVKNALSDNPRDLSITSRRKEGFARRADFAEKKIAYIDKQIVDLQNQKMAIANKYNIKKQELHDVTDLVEEGLKKGWIWLYQSGVKARGETTIDFDADYLKAFKKVMSVIAGVKENEIEAIAVTNHSVDYSIGTSEENLAKYMREIKDISEFTFEAKDNEDSKHGYGFVKIKGRWYGIVKLGGPWDSRGIARKNAGNALAYNVGQDSGDADVAALAFGLVSQNTK